MNVVVSYDDYFVQNEKEGRSSSFFKSKNPTYSLF
jgi:hypothetical protein